jgi:hypothetical protein
MYVAFEVDCSTGDALACDGCFSFYIGPMKNTSDEAKFERMRDSLFYCRRRPLS